MRLLIKQQHRCPAWGLTWLGEDRGGKPRSGSPIYSDGSGCRPALAAAASPDSLTPPRVHAVLVLDLLAALSCTGWGRATVGGAPASQARSWSRGSGGGRGWRSALHHLLQGGALPQRIQAGAAATWSKPTRIKIYGSQSLRWINQCFHQSAVTGPTAPDRRNFKWNQLGYLPDTNCTKQDAFTPEPCN